MTVVNGCVPLIRGGDSLKLRIEISDELPDEVVIRCSKMTDEVLRLKGAFESVTGGTELTLSMGDSEYFVPTDDILFFETDDGKVAAHTADRMYYTEEKLFELEKMLPPTFMRVSKSCILNSAKVTSLTKNSLTGSAEVTFAASRKKTYVSRMYYRSLRNLIYETRLSK